MYILKLYILLWWFMKTFNLYNYLYNMVPVCPCSYGYSAYSHKTLDEMLLFKYNQKSVVKVRI